jgi:thioredoxin 1
MATTETFGSIINGDTPVLVDFFAEWCGPCKMMPPILQQVHAQLGDKVRIIKIDVDRNQQLASELNVSSVPTIALFHKGEIKWRQPGVQPANVLVEIIKKHTPRIS